MPPWNYRSKKNEIEFYSGWRIKSGGNVRFTAEGELKAEKLLKSRMANKKQRVLRKFMT